MLTVDPQLQSSTLADRSHDEPSSAWTVRRMQSLLQLTSRAARLSFAFLHDEWVGVYSGQLSTHDNNIQAPDC